LDHTEGGFLLPPFAGEVVSGGSFDGSGFAHGRREVSYLR
jgi:hypothetical protein